MNAESESVKLCTFQNSESESANSEKPKSESLNFQMPELEFEMANFQLLCMEVVVRVRVGVSGIRYF